MMNALETGMYLVYAWGVLTQGKREVVEGKGVEGAAGKGAQGGRRAAKVLLVGFAAAVMTVSKTVLYCKSSLSACS